MGRKKVKYSKEKSKGLNLNGVNNYVDITNAAMPVGDFEFSVSVKVKITQTVGYNVIWGYGVTNSVMFSAIGLFMRNGKITVEHNNLSSSDTVNNFGIGEYTITVTKRFGFIVDTLNIYIDGVLQVLTHNLVSLTDVLNLGNTEVNIGKWVTGGFPFYNAANFKMYQFHTKELSQIEVTNIASDGVITDNLLRYYDFTEGQGFVLTDKSTFLSNGTLINYTLADVTIGIGNSWTYEDGTPFTNLRSIVIPQLIEYNIGEGLRFNGVNNYVQLPVIPYFTTLAPFSIAVILNHQNLDGLIRVVWGVYGAVLGGGRNLFQAGNDLVFLFYGFSQIIGFAYDISFFANQIIHICYTFSVTDGLKLYINGNLVQSQAGGWTLDVGLQNSPIVLGNSGDLLYDYNKSTLYDFKVFNKALTQEEVQEDFDSNGASILASASPNLIAWYPIREQEGFVLKDQSTNALNGTLTNYSLADTTIGIDNKRVDKYGNPITQY